MSQKTKKKKRGGNKADLDPTEELLKKYRTFVAEWARLNKSVIASFEMFRSSNTDASGSTIPQGKDPTAEEYLCKLVSEYVPSYRTLLEEMDSYVNNCGMALVSGMQPSTAEHGSRIADIAAALQCYWNEFRNKRKIVSDLLSSKPGPSDTLVTYAALLRIEPNLPLDSL